MAPKAKPLAELGSVEKHGNGWRAKIRMDKGTTLGPQRGTRAAGQADLDTARQSASRCDMVRCLASLAQQVTGEDEKSLIRQKSCSEGDQTRTVAASESAIVQAALPTRRIFAKVLDAPWHGDVADGNKFFRMRGQLREESEQPVQRLAGG